MLAWGTNVEVRDLDGNHGEDLLLDLARSFGPLGYPKPEPFALRSYWSRYPRYDVHLCRHHYRPPSSFWRWRWPWTAAGHKWQTDLPHLHLSGLESAGERVFAPAWRFDGACIFENSNGSVEIQLLFDPFSGSGHSRLWVRKFRITQPPIPRPKGNEWPPLDSYSGYRGFSRSLLLSESGIRFFVASHGRKWGPHDALWWQGDSGYLLQVSAAVNHDIASVIQLLQRLIGEPIHVLRIPGGVS